MGAGQGGCLEHVFSYVTLYQSNTHCSKFSSRFSIRLPGYGLRKNSLRHLAKGCNSK